MSEMRICKDCSESLPAWSFDGRHASCNQCIYKRRKARQEAANRPFTPVEDDLIRQLYPSGGTPACVAVMPNRTTGSIHGRAFKLGIVFGTGRMGNDGQWQPDPLNVTADAWRGPVNLGVMRWAA